MKTLADLLKEETQALEERAKGWVYLNYPYPCSLNEAMAYARKYKYPSKKRMTIEREPTRTRIILKPLKGSRKRKPHVIQLWTA